MNAAQRRATVALLDHALDETAGSVLGPIRLRRSDALALRDMLEPKLRVGAARAGEGRKAPTRPKRKIPARSPKALSEWPKYRRERDEFLARPEHQWCEYPDGCGRRAVVVHHRRGREPQKDLEGGRLRDQRWWAASCDEHNATPEDATGHDRDIGWLLSMHRGAEGRPEPGRYLPDRQAKRESA